MRTHNIIPALVAIILTALAVAACKNFEDRLPPAPVRLTFTTVGDWNKYGISGAYNHRMFIKEERVPADFPYTALSETGYGGLLLTTDMHGQCHVFDLACPVEMRRSVRVAIDPEHFNARCPVCGSTYDVFDNLGMPLSGPALDNGYRLTRYNIAPGGAGEWMVITR